MGYLPLPLGYIHVLNCVSSYVFFSETACAIFIRFHMGPSVERILTIYLNGSAPLNKIDAIPIYGKNT